MKGKIRKVLSALMVATLVLSTDTVPIVSASELPADIVIDDSGGYENIDSVNSVNEDINLISNQYTEDTLLNEVYFSPNNVATTYATELNTYEEGIQGYISYGMAEYYGNSGIWIYERDSGSNTYYVEYSNTTIDNSKYIVYHNAVKADKYYDLVIYPFCVTNPARINLGSNIDNLDTSSKRPGFSASNGMMGAKIIVTESYNINNPVSFKCMFGSSDMDDDEYFIVPSYSTNIHKGEHISVINESLGIKYHGTTESRSDEEKYKTNCFFDEILIPTNGIIIYYGCDSDSRRITSLVFDDIKDYCIDNLDYTYVIKFDKNGGGSIWPYNDIERFGLNSSVVMGNIASHLPRKTGHQFKGWSASSNWSNKRIVYNSNSGGTIARDGTTALETSSSWTYADYCNNTGGSTASRTLILYAQYEPNQSTLIINPNGGSWQNSAEVQNFTQDYNTTKDIPIPIRDNYEFLGWERTNTYGTLSSLTENATYTFGEGNNVTDTITAQWKPLLAPYTVKHYKMNTDGSTYTLAETETFEGLIGSNVTPGVKTYTNFTSPSVQTKTVLADGSLVINYYYTRNKANYKVNHYKMNTDGSTYTLAESETYRDYIEKTVL